MPNRLTSSASEPLATRKQAGRWRPTTLALAAAIAAAGTLSSLDAHALGLGWVTVLSRLGEPLRAEVELTTYTAADIDSLLATPAPLAMYELLGLTYSETAQNLQTSLQRRANGEPFVSVSSTAAINAVFFDLAVKAQWASGNITRGYTLMLEAATAPAPERISLPQIAAAASPAAPAPAPAAETSRPTGAETVTAAQGQTASELAAQYKSPELSLDQMLLGLLQVNPQAFADNNVNRLMAGARLTLPTAEQASQSSPEEARQVIAAQSRDFNAYRQQLAEQSPPAPIAAPGNLATGTVSARVQDKQPGAPAADKLTLSKGEAADSLEAQAAQLARQEQARATAQRLSELSRNVQELERLSATKTVPAGGPGTVAGAADTATQGVNPGALTPSLTQPGQSPTGQREGLVQRLIAQPAVLPAAGGLLALLAGLAFFRSRRRGGPAEESAAPLPALQKDGSPPLGNSGLKPSLAAADHAPMPAPTPTPASSVPFLVVPAAVTVPATFFELDLSLGNEAPSPVVMALTGQPSPGAAGLATAPADLAAELDDDAPYVAAGGTPGPAAFNLTSLSLDLDAAAGQSSTSGKAGA